MFNTIFGYSHQFVKQIDQDMRDKHQILVIMANDIKSNITTDLYDIKIGLDKKPDFRVKKLHNSLAEFFYTYQKAIPFNKIPDLQYLQPAKYWFKKGLRATEQTTFYHDFYYIWINQAVIFLNDKPDLTDKILAIYSELDYYYQFPITHNKNELQNWRFKMNENGMIIHKSEIKTLQTILEELITFQEGLINDNQNTRNWGLYNSSFYNVVMVNTFIKILSDIEISIALPQNNIA
jgi:hypothetical protein